VSWLTSVLSQKFIGTASAPPHREPSRGTQFPATPVGGLRDLHDPYARRRVARGSRYADGVLRTRPRRSASLRLLTDHDRDEVLALCDRDPIANVFVGSRVRSASLDPARLGGQLWGYPDTGELTAACYSGPTWCRSRPGQMPSRRSRPRRGCRVGAAHLSWVRPQPSGSSGRCSRRRGKRRVTFGRFSPSWPSQTRRRLSPTR
jgi:hypothetical protein